MRAIRTYDFRDGYSHSSDPQLLVDHSRRRSDLALDRGDAAILHLGAALAWNVTGADLGGPLWPMTVVYTGALTTAACGNVALLRVIRRR